MDKIAKRNADQTRIDRMRKLNAKSNKKTIQNATYLGKASDGTDIVQIDGQTGATSGYRLISNKSMAIGDRVQFRPSPSGLQRVDAKNQPPQAKKLIEIKPIPVIDAYTISCQFDVDALGDETTNSFSLSASGTPDVPASATNTETLQNCLGTTTITGQSVEINVAYPDPVPDPLPDPYTPNIVGKFLGITASFADATITTATVRITLSGITTEQTVTFSGGGTLIAELLINPLGTGDPNYQNQAGTLLPCVISGSFEIVSAS